MVMSVSRLSGLKAANYILNCVIRGESKDEIVKQFEGDEQLVDIWMSFIKHNHWIEQNEFQEWFVTEKGKSWASKLDGK